MISDAYFRSANPCTLCGRAGRGAGYGGVVLCREHAVEFHRAIEEEILAREAEVIEKWKAEYRLEAGLDLGCPYEVFEGDCPHRDVEQLTLSSLGSAKVLDAESVYYLDTGTGFVKIGYSTNPSQRIQSHLGYWPHLRFLVNELGDGTKENMRHFDFSAFRLRGTELFHPAPCLLEHIKRLQEVATHTAGPSIETPATLGGREES